MRELQHKLRAILEEVERGETIVVRKRNRALARIVPIQAEPRPWPDLQARLDAIYGSENVSPATSSLIYSDRGE